MDSWQQLHGFQRGGASIDSMDLRSPEFFQRCELSLWTNAKDDLSARKRYLHALHRHGTTPTAATVRSRRPRRFERRTSCEPHSAQSDTLLKHLKSMDIRSGLRSTAL